MHGFSCSSACGIFPDQRLNWCPCVARQTLNHWTTRVYTLDFEGLMWRGKKYVWYLCTGLPSDSAVKDLPANAGDAGSIPGSGRSPGGLNGNPLQYSRLGNPMDRGAWQATVHGVAKESDTTYRLKNNNVCVYLINNCNMKTITYWSHIEMINFGYIRLKEIYY